MANSRKVTGAVMYRDQRDDETEDTAKSVTIDLESQNLTILNISAFRLSGATPQCN